MIMFIIITETIGFLFWFPLPIQTELQIIGFLVSYVFMFIPICTWLMYCGIKIEDQADEVMKVLAKDEDSEARA